MAVNYYYPTGNNGWSGATYIVEQGESPVSACLGPGSGYTNWKLNGAARYYNATYTDGFSLASNQRIYRVGYYAEVSSLGPSPGYYISFDFAFIIPAGQYQAGYHGSGVYADGASQTAWQNQKPGGGEWVASSVNNLECKLQIYTPTDKGTSNVARVKTLAIKVDIRHQPVVTATGPTGSSTDTTPTITWSHYDQDGDYQNAYHVKVFTSPQADPENASATWNSLPTASGASSVTTSALAVGTYYAYVKTAKIETWDYNRWWSAWSMVSFTITEVPPDPPPDPEDPPPPPPPAENTAPTVNLFFPGGGGGSVQDARLPVNFQWTYYDLEDFFPAQSEVRWRIIGETIWNLVVVPGPDDTLEAALAEGSYEWQARVQDSGGLWSAFTASNEFVIDPVPPPRPVLEGPDDIPGSDIRQSLYDGRPEYICIAWDLVNQEALGELPLESMTYGYVLNGAGQLSASIPMGLPQAAPDILMPGRTAIHIYRNRQPVWAGILWGLQATIVGSAQRISLDASEYWSAFLRGSDTARYVRHDDLGLVSPSIDQVDIARELVEYAQDTTLHGPMVDLDISTVNQASGVAREDVFFDAADLKPIGEAVLEMAEAYTGFDFRIDLSGELGEPLVKTFRCIYPRQSEYVPHLALDNIRGVVKLDYQEDALRMARRFLLRGLEGIENNFNAPEDGLLIDGDYVYREFLRTYGDVEDDLALDDIALAASKRYGRPPRLPRISVRNGSGEIQWIGALLPGDFVDINLDLGYIVLQDSFRVVKFDVAMTAGLEVITLTLNEDVEVPIP